MINFPHSTFTWKSKPWEPDPYYKYAGGFVGKPGQVYHVRFNLESRCEISDEKTGNTAELFLGAPCRTEYTIARRNLFQIPSGEFRMAFSGTSRVEIAGRPSREKEELKTTALGGHFQEHRVDIRGFPDHRELRDPHQIIEATLNNEPMNARNTYHKGNFTVSVEYPINLINLNEADGEFQVCTGPMILPDLDTWNGTDVARVFLAHAAFTDFDFVEFILRRYVEAAESEKKWFDLPRGRDRHELLDPNRIPPDYPKARPHPTVYSETWEMDSQNVVLAVRL